MKKLLLIAFLVTLSTGVAIAQGPNGSGQGAGGPGKGMAGNPGNPVDRMVDQLGLDDEQAAAVAAIFEASQALHQEEREKCREVATQIRANTQAQILEVLTPEQAALHEELQLQREEFRRAYEDMRQSRGGSGGGYGGRGTGDCNG